MNNAYPEKPEIAYEKTTVAMGDVVTYLQSLGIAAEIKRTTYVIFRNESGNGSAGVNNNYVGAQADGGRWPPEFDDKIVGTVVKKENQTGMERLFVAFGQWSDSVDFLADRVQARGLFIGGQTNHITHVAIGSEADLALAYQREWVKGSANYNPSEEETENFLSMYHQGVKLFA
jgi:hypothetical protein